MKKKFAAIVVVMAVWASGFYALGRHHGVTKGPMDLPAVSVKWGAEQPKATEATEVKDVNPVTNICVTEVDQSVTVAK